MLLVLLAAATIHAQPDTGRPAVPPPLVQLFADDTVAASNVFDALGAELRIDGGAPPSGPRGARGVTAAPAELRVTKRADASTPTLAAYAATGRRLVAAIVEIPGATGGAEAMRVRLLGATIVSARLVVPAAGADVPGQRLAHEVTVSQLTADRDEAARQLAEAVAVVKVESRDAQRLVPANALARARDQVRMLDLRLAAARRQLALFEERVATASRPTEELVIRAERTEIIRAPLR